MKLTDRIGERYGRLVVVERAAKAANPKDTNARWLCKCDCGKSAVAYGCDLKRGKVVSCGCWNAEKRIKHGMSRTHINGVWRGMLDRCRNPKSREFGNYGGRGIKVCERWNDFSAFFADMGHRPPGYQIDRINNDGNYEPGNCRWATPKQQQNNKRETRMLEFNGKTQSLGYWAVETGIKWDTLRCRLRYGWSAEKTLTTPVLKIKSKLKE